MHLKMWNQLVLNAIRALHPGPAQLSLCTVNHLKCIVLSYRSRHGELSDREFLVWIEGALTLKLPLHLHHAPFWGATVTGYWNH